MVANIISSDCLGGRLFENLDSQFINPFIWNSIKLSDFLKIIEKWGNIDLKNIKLSSTNGEFGKYKDLSTVSCDNLFKAYFHHHILSPKHKTPTYIHKQIDNLDIAYYDILNYLKERWLRRVDRMTGNPIFIYNDKPDSTDVDLKEFVKIKTSYMKILVTTKKDFLKYECENLKVYVKRAPVMYSDVLAKELLESDKLSFLKNETVSE